MRKIGFCSIIILMVCFVANSSYGAIFSINWEGTVDSKIQDTVIVTAPGTYHFDIVVSDIGIDETISEFQFDLINPLNTSFNTAEKPEVGNPATNWLNVSDYYLNMGVNKQGFQVILNKFMSQNHLTDGTLLLGFEIEILPEFSSGELLFMNPQGADAAKLDFKSLTLNAVPIPSTLLLLGGGIFALVGGSRRKNRK